MVGRLGRNFAQEYEMKYDQNNGVMTINSSLPGISQVGSQEEANYNWDIPIAASGVLAQKYINMSDRVNSVSKATGSTSATIRYGMKSRIYNRQRWKNIGTTFRGVSFGLTAYSGFSTYSAYDRGEISGARASYNFVNTGIGFVNPFAGLAISVGDYYGQKYAPQIEYQITKGQVSDVMKSTFRALGMKATPYD